MKLDDLFADGQPQTCSTEPGIRITCIERDWYPFLFSENDQIKGLLLDIVKKSLDSLNITYSIGNAPVYRTVYNAENGDTDVVVALSYSENMARSLDFPEGAELDRESEWRIMQIDRVVVSFAGDRYELEGDLKTLPTPIRVLTGSPIINDLEETGIKYEKVKNDMQNSFKLIRDKHGTVIVSSVVAEMMNRDSRFSGKLKIHAKPVSSDSYHLVLSKRSRISSQEKEVIWKEIVHWRNDYIFMLQIMSHN